VITYIDVPVEIDQLDARVRALSGELYADLSHFGAPRHCNNGFDLFSELGAALFFIKAGIFKYYYGNKMVRLYQSDDIFIPVDHAYKGNCRCVSEFGADIHVVTAEQLRSLAATVPDAVSRLVSVIAFQSCIMHALCALSTTDEVTPDFSFKNFATGMDIITEGDPAKEIYMLLSGSAQVTVKHAVVGNVCPGEVFGEISFFTSGVRSATVTATSECVVQIMNKDDFLALVKVKPSVNLAISKTLSERLIETNRKIAEQHPPAL